MQLLNQPHTWISIFYLQRKGISKREILNIYFWRNLISTFVQGIKFYRIGWQVGFEETKVAFKWNILKCL